MANRTDPSAQSIHGTNPQNLVEKILRAKIYQTMYWKESCFGLTAETIVDKAMEIDHYGGTYGGNKRSTPFMCLTLKMLQIQPEKEIVVEFIKNEDYKYVRILGAFYLRLVGKPLDVYQYLEPLYNDYRKLRQKTSDGKFTLAHVDEFVDELLTKDYCCDIALPRLPKRNTLENTGQLEARRSALEDDFEDVEEEEEEKEEAEEGEAGKDSDGSERSREVDRDEKRSPIRDHDHGRRGDDRGRGVRDDRDRRDRDRERPRDRNRDRDRRDRDRDDDRRHRDRDRDRHRDDDRRLRDRDRDRDYEQNRDRDRPRDRDRDRDRDREHDHDGNRDRDRNRGDRSPERRKRYRSESRSPEPPRREEKERGGKKEEGKEKKEKKKKEKSEGAGKLADGTDHPNPEIAEANKLRASLGLKPLRV